MCAEVGRNIPKKPTFAYILYVEREMYMKKLFSVIVSIAMLIAVAIPSVFAAEAERVTVKVTDKSSKAVANARIFVQSDNGKWAPRAYYTDKNGEIRLYDRTDELKKPVNTQATYSVTVILRKPDATQLQEHFTLKPTAMKNGETVTIQLKAADTQADVYKAKQRTDIFLKNSQGAPVCNMLVALEPISVNIPQTDTELEVKSSQNLYQTFPIYYGYTDNDGRVTFLNLDKSEYTVKFQWLDGECAAKKFKVSDNTAVTTVNYKFDETLLK